MVCLRGELHYNTKIVQGRAEAVYNMASMRACSQVAYAGWSPPTQVRMPSLLS